MRWVFLVCFMWVYCRIVQNSRYATAYKRALFLPGYHTRFVKNNEQKVGGCCRLVVEAFVSRKTGVEGLSTSVLVCQPRAGTHGGRVEKRHRKGLTLPVFVHTAENVCVFVFLSACSQRQARASAGNNSTPGPDLFPTIERINMMCNTAGQPGVSRSLKSK